MRKEEYKIKTLRVEKHNINKSNPMFKIVDELCFKSKNLYNYANYIIRQEFIKNGKYINYYDMKKELKSHEPFKDLGSQAAQQTLSVLDEAWISFFSGIKRWNKNKEKFLGKPNMPKYKDKNGRNVVILSNIQFKNIEGVIKFSWKPFRKFEIHTKVIDKLMQIRFVPKGSQYTMEIVYEIDVPECSPESKRIVGIDLGVDNFATISNNAGLKPFIVNGKIIKSINQYYNKKRAKLSSDLALKNGMHWSNNLQKLTEKRNNKIQYFIHKSSKYVIDWCIKNKIDTIIVGINNGWKQNSPMSKKINQNFISIPYNSFINTLKYKCENVGIKFIETEESYTSGTSFVDNELPIKENYNKSRRIKRGIFKNKDGVLINADLNGSYQIIKKVFPNAFADGIEDVHLHPVRVNLI